MEMIEKWVREMVLELNDVGINVDKVILFGSFAKGTFAEGSDVDLIVISEDWSELNQIERIKLLYRIWDKPLDANFLAYTPEEFEKKLNESVVLRDASKYWKVIYAREGRKSQNTCA